MLTSMHLIYLHLTLLNTALHLPPFQSKKYHIQEKDKQRVVAMVWDSTGTRLLCAYSSGKLVKVRHDNSTII